MNRQLLLLCTICILICLAVGGISGLTVQNGGGEWYAALKRPPLNPPAQVFGIVWPILYVLMGIAAGLIWARGWQTAGVKQALLVFGIQLVLNGLWSPLFFGLHWIGAALAECILLWAMVLAAAARFKTICPSASLLLWPYLGWLTFAVYLNAGYWILNR
ncbi:MAG TPA: tryptophan-rich sensory protein [Anaerohalosphaeraceae bacterium]|nr:tryptophan-rich sensory protein [Phycisphaerae bacterium]HOK96051.1 tryptophan-rich sensory protein [Anaerohalosphaeraceae bacterium]HOM76554.1 tryptophan-rich sensory protein [Anaerohalosphaeraceae bacterium]HPC64683.1 tryptophan-rich sensory protein [Anaerohalosphaeraceae bacterium]HRS71742.1 tryptophan-rich sensory protein [Anaerohalosphaeraceae bacterium]